MMLGRLRAKLKAAVKKKRRLSGFNTSTSTRKSLFLAHRNSRKIAALFAENLTLGVSRNKTGVSKNIPARNTHRYLLSVRK